MKLSRLRLDPGLSGVSWRSIEILVLTAIFFLPFSKSIAEGCIFAALSLWILRKFPWNEQFPRVAFCNIPYLILLVFVLLSLIQVPGEFLPTALRGVGKWVKHLGIFFMAFEYFREAKRAERFVTVFLSSTTLVCLDGFYQMGTGFDLIKHYSADTPGRLVRMQGPLSSPNDLASLLILGLPVVFFCWMKEKSWSVKSALLAFLAVLFGVTLVTTLSRGAMLALFISIVFYVLCTQKKKRLWVLAVLPLIFLASPLLRYNFFTSLELKDITVGERLKMWEVCLKMIQAHPWVGNGANLFAEKFDSFSGWTKHYNGYAHNCYLQMAAEIGVPGLLAFVFPFLAVLPKAIAKKYSPSGLSWLRSSLLVGIPAFLIQAALDTNFYALQAAMLFWLFWGMCAALILQPDKALTPTL